VGKCLQEAEMTMHRHPLQTATIMNRNARHCFIATILLLGVSGCVHESLDGQTRTFTYDLWVPLSVLMGGLVAVPAGWFLRKTSARFGWGLLVIGPVVAIFFAPSLFRDRAVVDDATFSLRTGIWGLTAVHEVKFEDLKQVRLISEEVRGRRGSKRTNYYLLCERRDGTSAKVPANNKMAKAAAPHFLRRVSERGIPILDET
jgi:hypothetical protein